MTSHPSIAPGRVAVITGGASGLSFPVAARLGKSGIQIVLADLPGTAVDRALDRPARDGRETHRLDRERHHLEPAALSRRHPDHAEAFAAHMREP